VALCSMHATELLGGGAAVFTSLHLPLRGLAFIGCFTRRW
jgi:hypothetical protein